jgi:hypothetical protein
LGESGFQRLQPREQRIEIGFSSMAVDELERLAVDASD